MRERHPERSTMSLAIPSRTRFFRPVRLAVGGMAATLGFDVEAIEDLRIGVDEICAALLEAGDGGELRLVVHHDDSGWLRIEGRAATGPSHLDGDRFRLSRQILSVVADDHGYELGDEEVRFWLERSASAGDGAADAGRP